MQSFNSALDGGFRFHFRRGLFSCLALLTMAMVLLTVPASATTLVYWDFNNDVTKQNGSNLGILYNSGSSPTNNNGFGEIYNTTTSTISSNSGSGAVFSTGLINMSGVAVGTGAANKANGGTTSATQGWGLLPGSSLSDQVSGDTTSAASADGGSLVIFGTNAATDTVVFTLSSTGYTDLVLSLDARNGSGGTTVNPVVTWAYSLDGTTWTTFSLTGSLSASAVWGNLSANLSSSLDNLSTFYIEEILTFPSSSSGNFAIDNVVLSGTAAVPEPSTLALMSLGMGLAFVWYRRHATQNRI